MSYWYTDWIIPPKQQRRSSRTVLQNASFHFREIGRKGMNCFVECSKRFTKFEKSKAPTLQCNCSVLLWRCDMCENISDVKHPLPRLSHADRTCAMANVRSDRKWRPTMMVTYRLDRKYAGTHVQSGVCRRGCTTSSGKPRDEIWERDQQMDEREVKSSQVMVECSRARWMNIRKWNAAHARTPIKRSFVM